MAANGVHKMRRIQHGAMAAAKHALNKWPFANGKHRAVGTDQSGRPTATLCGEVGPVVTTPTDGLATCSGCVARLAPHAVAKSRQLELF